MVREIEGNSTMENQEGSRNMEAFRLVLMEKVELIRRGWAVNEVIWAG